MPTPFSGTRRRTFCGPWGQNQLVSLRVGGTASAPTFTVTKRITIPWPAGHDIQPVFGNDNLLWVATGSYVYQYSKSANTFSTTYPLSSSVNVRGVKSIGGSQNGQALITRPKANNPCTWCTDTVEFYGPTATRLRAGAQIYRARLWTPLYQ